MGIPNVSNDNKRNVQAMAADVTDQGSNYLSDREIKLQELIGKYMGIKIQNDALYLFEQNIRRIYGASI
jgi:hypothetical protein